MADERNVVIDTIRQITVSASRLGYTDLNDPESVTVEAVYALADSVVNELAASKRYPPEKIRELRDSVRDTVLRVFGREPSPEVIIRMKYGSEQHQRIDQRLTQNEAFRRDFASSTAYAIGVKPENVTRVISETQVHELLPGSRTAGINPDTVLVVQEQDGTYSVYVPDMKAGGTFSDTQSHTSLAVQQAIYLNRIFDLSPEEFKALTGVSKEQARRGTKAVFVNTGDLLRGDPMLAQKDVRDLDFEYATGIVATIQEIAQRIVSTPMGSKALETLIHHGLGITVAGDVGEYIRKITQATRGKVKLDEESVRRAASRPVATQVKLPRPISTLTAPRVDKRAENIPIIGTRDKRLGVSTGSSASTIEMLAGDGVSMITKSFNNDHELLDYLKSHGASGVNDIALQSTNRGTMAQLLGILRTSVPPMAVRMPQQFQDMIGTPKQELELKGHDMTFRVGDIVGDVKITAIREVTPGKHLLYGTHVLSSRELAIPVEEAAGGVVLFNGIAPIPMTEVNAKWSPQAISDAAAAPKRFSAREAFDVAVTETLYGHTHSSRVTDLRSLTPAAQIVYTGHVLASVGGRINLDKLDPRELNMFFPRSEMHRVMGEESAAEEALFRLMAVPTEEILRTLRLPQTSLGPWAGISGGAGKAAKLVKRAFRPTHVPIAEGFKTPERYGQHYGIQMSILGAGVLPQGSALVVLPKGVKQGQLQTGVRLSRHIKLDYTGMPGIEAFVPVTDDWIKVEDGYAAVGHLGEQEIRVPVGRSYDRIRLSMDEGDIYFDENGVSLTFMAAAPAFTSKFEDIKANLMVLTEEEAAAYLGTSVDAIGKMRIDSEELMLLGGPDIIKSSGGLFMSAMTRNAPEALADLEGATPQQLLESLHAFFSVDNPALRTGTLDLTGLKSLQAAIVGAQEGKLGQVPYVTFESLMRFTAEAPTGGAKLNPNMAAWFAQYFPEYYRRMERYNYTRSGMTKETILRAIMLTADPEQRRHEADVIHLEQRPELMELFTRGDSIGTVFRNLADILRENGEHNFILSAGDKYIPSAQALAQMSTHDPNNPTKELNPFVRAAYGLIIGHGSEQSVNNYLTELEKMRMSENMIADMLKLQMPYATTGPFSGHPDMPGAGIFIPPHQLMRMIPGLSRTLSRYKDNPETQLDIIKRVYSLLEGEMVAGTRQPLLDVLFGVSGLKVVNPWSTKGLQSVASQLERDPLSRSLQMLVADTTYEPWAADTDWDLTTIAFLRNLAVGEDEAGHIQVHLGRLSAGSPGTVIGDLMDDFSEEKRFLGHRRKEYEQQYLKRLRDLGVLQGGLGERVTDLNSMQLYATVRFAQARMSPEDAERVEALALSEKTGISMEAIKFISSLHTPGSQLGAMASDAGIFGAPFTSETMRKTLGIPETVEQLKSQILTGKKLADAGMALTRSKAQMGVPFSLALRPIASAFFRQGVPSNDLLNFYRDFANFAQLYQKLLDLGELTPDEGAALGALATYNTSQGQEFVNPVTGKRHAMPPMLISKYIDALIGGKAGLQSNTMLKMLDQIASPAGQMARRLQSSFKNARELVLMGEPGSYRKFLNPQTGNVIQDEIALQHGNEFVKAVVEMLAKPTENAIRNAINYILEGTPGLYNKNIPGEDKISARLQEGEVEILETLRGMSQEEFNRIIGILGVDIPGSPQPRIRPASPAMQTGHSVMGSVPSGNMPAASDFFRELMRLMQVSDTSTFAEGIRKAFQGLVNYASDAPIQAQAPLLTGAIGAAMGGRSEDAINIARRIRDRGLATAATKMGSPEFPGYSATEMSRIAKIAGFVGNIPKEGIEQFMAANATGVFGKLLGPEGRWQRSLGHATTDIERQLQHLTPSEVPQVLKRLDVLSDVATQLESASKSIKNSGREGAVELSETFESAAKDLRTKIAGYETTLDTLFAPDEGLVAAYTQTLDSSMSILEKYTENMKQLVSRSGERLTPEEAREVQEAAAFYRNYSKMARDIGYQVPQEAGDLGQYLEQIGVLRARPAAKGAKGFLEKISDPRQSFGSDMYFMMRNMRMFVEPLVSGGQQYQQYQAAMNQMRARAGFEPDMQSRQVMANIQGMNIARARTGGYILSGMNGMLGQGGLGNQTIADILGIGGASLGVGMIGSQLLSMMSLATPWALPIIAAVTGAGLGAARIFGESKDENLMRARIAAVSVNPETINRNQALNAKLERRRYEQIVASQDFGKGGVPIDFYGEEFQRQVDALMAQGAATQSGAEITQWASDVGLAGQVYNRQKGYIGSPQAAADIARVRQLLGGAIPETEFDIEYLYGQKAGPEYEAMRQYLTSIGYSDTKQFGYGLGGFMGIEAENWQAIKPYAELQAVYQDIGVSAEELTGQLTHMAASLGMVGDEIKPFIKDTILPLMGAEPYKKLAGAGLSFQYMQQAAGLQTTANLLGTNMPYFEEVFTGQMRAQDIQQLEHWASAAQSMARMGITLPAPTTQQLAMNLPQYSQQAELQQQFASFLYGNTPVTSRQIETAIAGMQQNPTAARMALGVLTSGGGTRRQVEMAGGALGFTLPEAFITRETTTGLPLGTMYGVTSGQFLGSYRQRMMQYMGTEYAAGITSTPTTMGLQVESWKAGYEANLASIGATIAGIRERMEKLPTIRSLQDAIRELNENASRRDLDFQQRALDLNTAQQRELFALTQEQITTRRGWLEQDTAREFSRLGTQNKWRREDYVANTAMQQMQFGWTAEDIQRELRFATGPQREALMRQLSRATIGYNFQNAQMGRQFQRGETQAQWSAEDIQLNYERQRQALDWEQKRLDIAMKYFDQENALQKERMDRARSDFEEQLALEEKLRAIQREMEDNELKRSLSAAGAQAAYINKMKTIQAMEDALNFARIVGQTKQFSFLNFELPGLLKANNDNVTGILNNVAAQTGPDGVIATNISTLSEMVATTITDMLAIPQMFEDIGDWFQITWGGKNGLWQTKWEEPWNRFMYDFDQWLGNISLPTTSTPPGEEVIGGPTHTVDALGGPILSRTFAELGEHGEEYVVPQHGALVMRDSNVGYQQVELLTQILATLMRIEAEGLRFVRVDAQTRQVTGVTPELYNILNLA